MNNGLDMRTRRPNAQFLRIAALLFHYFSFIKMKHYLCVLKTETSMYIKEHA